MIVIMLSDCPPKVRGDLSKWLCEINTGVFVGNVSSRVREEVWQRICENIKSGQATMHRENRKWIFVCIIQPGSRLTLME